MRVSSVGLKEFRRFADLQIVDLPETARLVVLAGPNGSGKSSIFDAFLTRYRAISGYGWSGDRKYFDRVENLSHPATERISITFHDSQLLTRGSVYVRTAYRNDPEFTTTSLTRQGPVLDNVSIAKLIQTDATVSTNYMRVASQAMEDVFVNEEAGTTMAAFRDKILGETREPFKRIFPHLTLVGVGNPLDNGTFRFAKGSVANFDYQNLSGGEKAAFDLLLDMVVKRRTYTDSIYCIDEPETHMNTKVQGALLQELLDLLPAKSQLWIASHSIGMLRKAREPHSADPASVTFLDFDGRDFDSQEIIRPESPTKAFWQRILNVALDDLANLVAPRRVIICEGNPISSVNGKNVEQDARIYSTIFSQEFPDVTFISAGSSSQVSGDFLALATALPRVASGMQITRLIDLDDHAPADVVAFQQQGITVLGRRHIEAYIFDNEVLTALCDSIGKSDAAPLVISAKQRAIADSMSRGNPADDIKSAAGNIYTETKQILGVLQCGNEKNSFMRNTLAPLIRPSMSIYLTLRRDIFGY